MIAPWSLVPTKIQTLDGQAAAETARRFLVRMGVQNLGGLVSLGPGWGDRSGQTGATWGVGFALPNGAGFSVQLTDRGKVFYAVRSDLGSLPPSPKVDAKTARRMVASLMARVPHALPTRPYRPAESFYPNTEFDIVKNGLTFFNMNPTYAYNIGADGRGGLVSFTVYDKLPPVASPKPKIVEKAARARLVARWGKREHQAPFGEHIVPQLGYYLVKGEPIARLVWRGWIYQDRSPLFDGAALIPGFLDANTGAFVPPNPGQ